MGNSKFNAGGGGGLQWTSMPSRGRKEINTPSLFVLRNTEISPGLGTSINSNTERTLCREIFIIENMLRKHKTPKYYHQEISRFS